MFVMTFATIVLMGVEYTVSRTSVDSAGNASYYWIGDLIFIVFTLTELIIKVYSFTFDSTELHNFIAPHFRFCPGVFSSTLMLPSGHCGMYWTGSLY